MIPHDPTIPTLPAYDTGAQFLVWCLWESVWHYHAREEGDRTAHCAVPTPYTSSGYVLKLAGKFEDLPPELVKERARLTARARRRRRRAA